MKKIYCFDIDGIICKTRGNDYKNSKPNNQIIKRINQLYSEGNIIKIFTARFMGRSDDNVRLAKKRGYKFTLKQLKKWKLKFHKLIFGKPSYHYIIDDRCLFFKKSFLKKI